MMNIDKIKLLLNDIEDSLGHYSRIGGPAPPFIKTDDKTIKHNIEKIRKILEEL